MNGEYNSPNCNILLNDYKQELVLQILLMIQSQLRKMAAFFLMKSQLRTMVQIILMIQSQLRKMAALFLMKSQLRTMAAYLLVKSRLLPILLMIQS